MMRYACEARSRNSASQCAASHIARRRCGSVSARCDQAADVLCKFFPHRCRITFSSSKISTRSHVSFADLIVEAICRSEHRTRVKIATACAGRLVNRRGLASMRRCGLVPQPRAFPEFTRHIVACVLVSARAPRSASAYDDASRRGPRLGRSRLGGQCDLGHSLQAGSRLSSTDLHASVPRDYASVIGDQTFWRF